jgi:hypothetical protein
VLISIKAKGETIRIGEALAGSRGECTQLTNGFHRGLSRSGQESPALQRFDDRRQLVIQEATAASAIPMAIRATVNDIEPALPTRLDACNSARSEIWSGSQSILFRNWTTAKLAPRS